MYKLKIDDEIVNAYINDENIVRFANDEIFILSSQDEDLSLFEEPLEDNRLLVNEIRQQLLLQLTNFSFKNQEKVLEFLGDINNFLKELTIKLVVGLPPKINKLFRSFNDQVVVVIDLNNWSKLSKDLNAIVDDIIDYISYVICLMALDSTLSPENEDQVSLLYHTIYIASFAFYISDSNQLNGLEESGEYATLYYLEDSILRKVLKHKQEKLANHYIGNIIQMNPEMEYLGITGKALLRTLKREERFEQIKTIFDKGSHYFINTLSQSKRKNKILLFKLYLIWSIILPLMAVSIVTWTIISMINNSFSLAIKIMPILYALLLIIHQVLKIINYQTKFKQFIFYLGLILILITIYTYFIFFYL